MAEKKIAVIGGEEKDSYCDDQSLYVGLVVADRDYGNTQIGPETLVHFHNGMKAWIPDSQLVIHDVESDEAARIMDENWLKVSEDGEGLTSFCPEEEAVPDNLPVPESLRKKEEPPYEEKETPPVEPPVGPSSKDEGGEEQTITRDDVGDLDDVFGEKKGEKKDEPPVAE